MNAPTIAPNRRPVIAAELDDVEPRVVGYCVHVADRKPPPCYRARVFWEYDAALAVAELVAVSGGDNPPDCSVVLAVAHGGVIVLADVAADGAVELVLVDGAPVVVGELVGTPADVSASALVE